MSTQINVRASLIQIFIHVVSSAIVAFLKNKWIDATLNVSLAPWTWIYRNLPPASWNIWFIGVFVSLQEGGQMNDKNPCAESNWSECLVKIMCVLFWPDSPVPPILYGGLPTMQSNCWGQSKQAGAFSPCTRPPWWSLLFLSSFKKSPLWMFITHV